MISKTTVTGSTAHCVYGVLIALYGIDLLASAAFHLGLGNGFFSLQLLSLSFKPWLVGLLAVILHLLPPALLWWMAPESLHEFKEWCAKLDLARGEPAASFLAGYDALSLHVSLPHLGGGVAVGVLIWLACEGSLPVITNETWTSAAMQMHARVLAFIATSLGIGLIFTTLEPAYRA